MPSVKTSKPRSDSEGGRDRPLEAGQRRSAQRLIGERGPPGWRRSAPDLGHVRTAIVGTQDRLLRRSSDSFGLCPRSPNAPRRGSTQSGDGKAKVGGRHRRASASSRGVPHPPSSKEFLRPQVRLSPQFTDSRASDDWVAEPILQHGQSRPELLSPRVVQHLRLGSLAG